MAKCLLVVSAAVLFCTLAGLSTLQASVSVIHVFDGEAHPGGLKYPGRDIGDFNGDSYADWACYTDENSVNVYFGGNPTDADADIVLQGENPEDRFGFSIAGTGDINGDDDIEFLVGAPGYGDNRGEAYMYAAATAGTPAADAESAQLVIGQVSPNPITGSIRIRYSVSQQGTVGADLYDVSGRFIRALSREQVLPGTHVLEIHLGQEGQRSIAPGVYFVRLSQNGQSGTKKLVVAE